MRALLLVVVLGGCDRVFELPEIPAYGPPADGAIDAAIDAPADAAIHRAGCADETREGFFDPEVYVDIAACAGAWSLPGLRDVTPACGYAAGNDGPRPTGQGCTAADVCAEGWHVCQDRFDAQQSLPAALRSCAGLGAGPNMFFATAQDGPGGDCESPDATDDFVGCGTYGLDAFANCAPLDRTTNNECLALRAVGGWSCPEFENEVNTVTKSEPLSGGGVLCCRND